MLVNSSLTIPTNDVYDYSDHFPLSYEDDNLRNGTYYDDYFLNNNNNNQSLNLTDIDVISFSSIYSFSSPFSYIFFILIVYLILTIILLSLSLYKQRQTEIDNFYFGDTDEEIEQSKRYLIWKQFLIRKIRKGDMEPLLIDTSTSKTGTFPLHIV